MRLDAKTAAQFEISREKAKKLIELGEVHVNGFVQTLPRFEVKDEDVITADITKLPIQETAMKANFEVELETIFEDDGMLIINKQKGLMVHEGNAESYNTIANILIAKYGETFKSVGSPFRPGIVHRLDKDTTGLMVIAKTQKTFEVLTNMIQNRTITRKYLAICYGIPERKAGTINANISTDPSNKTRRKVVQTGGKEAVTHYKMLSSYNGISLIECTLETGRTHQIRVHLAHINLPILGDKTYNRHAKNGINKELSSQALHAYKLELKNPTTGEVLKLTHYGAFENTIKLFGLTV